MEDQDGNRTPTEEHLHIDPSLHTPDGPDHPSSVQSRTPVPVNISTPSSTGGVRRGPVSVDRPATRMHITSPYLRHPPASDISSDHLPPKKKRKRADSEQLRVLNEAYARTAFPTTEERQELAVKLNLAPMTVQIWYVSCFHSSTAHLIFTSGFKTNDSGFVTYAVNRPQFEDPGRRRLITLSTHPNPAPTRVRL